MKRQMKLVAYRVARSIGLFGLARRCTRNSVRILCYHGVWRGGGAFAGDAMFISGATFQQRLETLRRLGYPVIGLGAAVGKLKGAWSKLDCPVVITIDDGWYSTFADMVPPLRAAGMPATLYCDTRNLLSGHSVPHVMARYLRSVHGIASDDREAELFAETQDLGASTADRLDAVRRWAEHAGLDLGRYEADKVFRYMDPEQLAALAAEGLIDIQLHTHSHSLKDFSEANMSEEITANREALTSILGRAVPLVHFAYPSGRYDARCGEILGRLGVETATTCDQALAAPGANLHYLPRLLDGEQVDEVEFEAELSGFADFVRRAGRAVRRLRHPGDI